MDQGTCWYNTPMSKSATLDSFLEILRNLKPELRARYQVEEVALFGSYVHHREKNASDLDLLVSFKEPPSLLRFIELENLLSERLRVKVDLVMQESLKPNIGRRILKEAVAV